MIFILKALMGLKENLLIKKICMEENLMTIEELYEFAKKHGFENASMWVSTGTNVWSSINSANLTVHSNESLHDRINRRVYLVYNS